VATHSQYLAVAGGLSVVVRAAMGPGDGSDRLWACDAFVQLPVALLRR
jgi:hypothetical protein